MKLLEASLELLVPLVIAEVIDGGIASGDTPYIIKMGLMLALLAASGLICTALAQYFSAKAAVGFTSQLRRALFKHIQSLSYSNLDFVGPSTLITRMTGDMNQVQTGLNLTLRLLLRSPFVVFGAMIMAFTIDVKSAMIFAVTIPVLTVVVFGIMLISIPLYKKVQAALDGVLGLTRENLTGARVIRAFRAEQRETDEFSLKNDTLTDMQRFVGRISALLNPITFIIINAAILLLMHRGAINVESGVLTQGQVIALYNYMSQILVELIKLADLIINITKSMACAGRISRVLDIEEGQAVDTSLPAGDKNEVVEFRNASLKYGGASENSLTDISLTAMRGEVIGIIGGTGCGKTTLVNMIPRFYDASEGAVYVDGADVRSVEPSVLRSKIGIVPQKAVLFRGTIRENLQFGDVNASDESIYEALRASQAMDVVESKGGLDAMIEQDGRNLSGGQRQRLTIARALVKKPEILILDDSASALDFATDAALRKALRALSYKPVTFIVSQRTSSVMSADKIAVLEDGRLVGLGSHEQLLNECETYREIYDSQF